MSSDNIQNFDGNFIKFKKHYNNIVADQLTPLVPIVYSNTSATASTMFYITVDEQVHSEFHIDLGNFETNYCWRTSNLHFLFKFEILFELKYITKFNTSIIKFKTSLERELPCFNTTHIENGV